MAIRVCGLIPLFNHGETVAGVAAALRAHLDRVIVVDDGSTDGGADRLPPDDPGLVVIRRSHNGGKGAAVKDGLRAARALGCTHVLQMDADAQHDPEDIPRFLEAGDREPGTIWTGERVFDADAPGRSRFGRRFGMFWWRVETGDRTLTDTQCGYRLYPLEGLPPLEDLGDRMDFDVEVLVRSLWRGTPVRGLPTRVHYGGPEHHRSHFRPFRDNLGMTWMHTRLCLARWSGRTRTPDLAPRVPRWLQVREVGSRTGIRIVLALGRLAGYRAARALTAAVATWYAMVAPGARRSLQEFHRRAVGRSSFGLAWRTIFSFAESILDRAFVAMGRASIFRLTVDAPDGLLDPGAPPKGHLVLGAHLGTLEMARAFAVTERVSFSMWMHAAPSTGLYRELRRLDPRFHESLIPMGSEAEAVEALLVVRDRIQAGHYVGVLADRVWPTGPRIRLPFLGREREFPLGPFKAAVALKAPVLLAFLVKTGHRDYRLVLRPLESGDADPGAPTRDRDARTRDLAMQYVRGLEEAARRFPTQWYHFFPFWDG